MYGRFKPVLSPLMNKTVYLFGIFAALSLPLIGFFDEWEFPIAHTVLAFICFFWLVLYHIVASQIAWSY